MLMGNRSGLLLLSILVEDLLFLFLYYFFMQWWKFLAPPLFRAVLSRMGTEIVSMLFLHQ
jgi:hypothetical protein